jgi:hypothetical protein
VFGRILTQPDDAHWPRAAACSGTGHSWQPRGARCGGCGGAQPARRRRPRRRDPRVRPRNGRAASMRRALTRQHSRCVMKERLASPTTGSPAPRAAGSATAPRLASVIGNHAMAAAAAGTTAPIRRPLSPAGVQLKLSTGRAPGGAGSHPARAQVACTAALQPGTARRCPARVPSPKTSRCSAARSPPSSPAVGPWHRCPLRSRSLRAAAHSRCCRCARQPP